MALAPCQKIYEFHITHTVLGKLYGFASGAFCVLRSACSAVDRQCHPSSAFPKSFLEMQIVESPPPPPQTTESEALGWWAQQSGGHKVHLLIWTRAMLFWREQPLLCPTPLSYQEMMMTNAVCICRITSFTVFSKRKRDWKPVCCVHWQFLLTSYVFWLSFGFGIWYPLFN